MEVGNAAALRGHREPEVPVEVLRDTEVLRGNKRLDLGDAKIGHGWDATPNAQVNRRRSAKRVGHQHWP